MKYSRNFHIITPCHVMSYELLDYTLYCLMSCTNVKPSYVAYIEHKSSISGIKHNHVLMHFDKPVSFGFMKDYFSHSHIEIVRNDLIKDKSYIMGNPGSVIGYETVLVDTFVEYGDFPS